MANGEGPERDFWLVRALRWPGRGWYFIAPATLLGLGVGAYCLRTLAPAAGDIASIVGLVISAGGFILTIWAVLETQRIDRESKAQLRRDIAKAQARTQEIVEQIGLDLTRAQCAEAHRRLTDALTATQHGHWSRAVEKLLEARMACRQLAGRGDVEVSEKIVLESGAEQLTSTISYLDDYKVRRATPSGAFPRKYRAPIDLLLNALEKLSGRLERQVMERAHEEG